VDWSARVELAIDPGYAGAYAVLALQWEPGLVRVVDELYVTQQVPLPLFASVEAESGGIV